MLQLSQKEMDDFVESGKPMIWQYNTLYQIEWSHGVQEYICRKIYVRSASMGVTKKGRFIAMTPEMAHSFR